MCIHWQKFITFCVSAGNIYKNFENWKILWRLCIGWVYLLFCSIGCKILLNFCKSAGSFWFFFYRQIKFIGFKYLLAKLYFALVFLLLNNFILLYSGKIYSVWQNWSENLNEFEYRLEKIWLGDGEILLLLNINRENLLAFSIRRWKFIRFLCIFSGKFYEVSVCRLGNF